MTLLNLRSKYDVKAELNKPYVLVSHTIESMNGDNGLYDVVVAVSEDDTKIGFSGKAIVSQFKTLERQLGNPYPSPVKVTIGEEPSKTAGGNSYRVVSSAELLD